MTENMKFTDMKPGDCKTVPLSTMNDFVRLVNATADSTGHRDSLRPELREAIDESWKLHEAAYRYLGKGHSETNIVSWVFCGPAEANGNANDNTKKRQVAL